MVLKKKPRHLYIAAGRQTRHPLSALDMTSYHHHEQNKLDLLLSWPDMHEAFSIHFSIFKLHFCQTRYNIPTSAGNALCREKIQFQRERPIYTISRQITKNTKGEKKAFWSTTQSLKTIFLAFYHWLEAGEDGVCCCRSWILILAEEENFVKSLLLSTYFDA